LEIAMRRKFSDRFLKSLKPAPAGKRDTIWDAVIPSFGVRVTDKGRVSFFVQRRPRGTRRPLRIVIGPYPALALAAARERARQLVSELAAGNDPRQLALAQRVAEENAKASKFKQVADDFIRRYVSKKRTATAIAQLIESKLISRWGERPIAEIARRDVIQMIEEITDAGTPASAHQTLIYARRLFNWAIARDAYGLAVSPCDRVSAKDLIGTLRPRQRVLSDAELRALWKATEGSPEATYPYSPFIRLLLLTGARRSELAEATWNEIDLEAGVWTIGGDRMKNGAPHAVALPSMATEIVHSLPRFDGPYVFSTTFGERPIQAFSKMKAHLDKRMTQILPNTLVAEWRLHDLRRTVRTNLARIGVSPLVAELVIGHKQRGIAAVYDLHRYEREKRDALNLWAGRLNTLIEPPYDNVVPIAAA
jgi:integrase